MLEKIFIDYQKVIGQQVIRANYTSYGEILKIHGCYEDSRSIVLTREDYDYFNEKKKYLSSKLLTYFAEHPLFTPLINDARTKMATRDYGFRQVLHENLEQYIDSVSKTDFDRFLGEKSKTLEERIDENIDVFKRLKDR